MFNPGYHLSPIPRGELGEFSKVLEEALECQDAHRQGVDLMVLIELSDMVGALNAFRDRHRLPRVQPGPGNDCSIGVSDLGAIVAQVQSMAVRQADFSASHWFQALERLESMVRGYLSFMHPSISWSDLEAMAEVTARAFRSGRRS